MTDEDSIARLTNWLRRRPNSIEFWELVLTDEQLLCCFVGESYRSMLLRADMGERDRALVADTTPAELEGLDERNFSIPLEALESIRLVVGTRLRRATLEIEWDDDEKQPHLEKGRLTLYAGRDADSQRDLVAGLADEPALAGVDVAVDSRRLPF
ncbi:hypothetical protein [Natronococcus occultus]|uniref:Uncharacterized protein n=1 Tax=Natronococcus occultus SP4 TaxID=694430 RepID=L0K5H1_9EURY|nr:hypothetical protein [Natronococcus occultus]AGB39343.1 hypothetical protein Natoc_3626 [Natronococcus occultus SP4]